MSRIPYIRCSVCTNIAVAFNSDKKNFICTKCLSEWEYAPLSYESIPQKEITCPYCEIANGDLQNIGVVKFFGDDFFGCKICRRKFKLKDFRNYQKRKSPSNLSPKKCKACQSSKIERYFEDKYYVAKCCRCNIKWIEIPEDIVIIQGKYAKVKVSYKCPNCGRGNVASNYNTDSSRSTASTVYPICCSCYIKTEIKWVGKHNGFCPKCSSGYPIYKYKYSDIFKCLNCLYGWESPSKKSVFKIIADRIASLTKEEYCHRQARYARYEVQLEDVFDSMTTEKAIMD